MATGAEGGAVGAGVAVHLPVNYHGLSEWEEKTEKLIQHRFVTGLFCIQCGQGDSERIWLHADELSGGKQNRHMEK